MRIKKFESYQKPTTPMEYLENLLKKDEIDFEEIRSMQKIFTNLPDGKQLEAYKMMLKILKKNEHLLKNDVVVSAVNDLYSEFMKVPEIAEISQGKKSKKADTPNDHVENIRDLTGRYLRYAEGKTNKKTLNQLINKLEEEISSLRQKLS